MNTKIISHILYISFVLYPVAAVHAQCTCEVNCVSTGPPTWTYSYTTTGSGSVENFTISGAAGITDASAPYPFRPIFSKDTVVFTIVIDTPCGATYDDFTITAPLSVDGEVTASCYSTTVITCGPFAISSGTPTPTPTPTFTVTPDFTHTPPFDVPHAEHHLRIFLIAVFGILLFWNRPIGKLLRER